jgi:hypothetical protein
VVCHAERCVQACVVCTCCRCIPLGLCLQPQLLDAFIGAKGDHGGRHQA